MFKTNVLEEFFNNFYLEIGYLSPFKPIILLNKMTDRETKITTKAMLGVFGGVKISALFALLAIKY